MNLKNAIHTVLLSILLLSFTAFAQEAQKPVDWQHEVLTRLDTVGAKIADGSVHVYSVLVHQAYVEGVADLIKATIAVLLSALAFVISVTFFRKAKNEDDGDCCLIGTITGILAISALLICVNFLTEGVMRLLNPEYYALHEVLQTVLGH
jgi:hypothetical protein